MSFAMRAIFSASSPIRSRSVIERVDRTADLLLDEAAHLQHARAYVLELDVELLGGVLGHPLLR
jgi:hypothetical protein